MDMRALETEADHAAAVAEIETLMNAEPGSKAFARLETLSALVDAYEAKVYPISAPDPVDAILFRLEQLADPRIEVSDYIDVSSRLKEFGCSQPQGIGILPERFDTCTSPDEFVLLSRTRTVVRQFEENHIPVSVIKKEGQNLPRLHTASAEWFTGVGPTLFVSAALLAENPHIISLALNVLANLLTDFFKGAREKGNAELEIVVEKEEKGGSKTSKKIRFAGNSEVLTAALPILSETLKQIDDAQ